MNYIFRHFAKYAFLKKIYLPLLFVVRRRILQLLPPPLLPQDQDMKLQYSNTQIPNTQIDKQKDGILQLLPLPLLPQDQGIKLQYSNIWIPNTQIDGQIDKYIDGIPQNLLPPLILLGPGHGAAVGTQISGYLICNKQIDRQLYRKDLENSTAPPPTTATLGPGHEAVVLKYLDT